MVYEKDQKVKQDRILVIGLVIVDNENKDENY